MAGPWEKYATPQQADTAQVPQGPWTRYAAPSAEPVEEPGFWDRAGEVATEYGGAIASGLRKGLSNIAGAPVEVINMAPMVGNILPGEQGFTPISENPVGGAQFFDELLRGGIPGVTDPVIPDFQPETLGGRVAKRIGEEVGATAVPVGAGLNAARRMTQAGRTVSSINPVARPFVEPFVLAPGRTTARELTYGTAAGSGAQLANETIGGGGDGEWWSDLIGSVGGVGALGAAAVGTNAGRYALGAARGDTRMFDDVAGEVVASRIIDNSSEMQDLYRRYGREAVDPENIARRLETPSRAEQMFPGFQADIADRARDPGISVLAYNTNTVLPGAAAARRNSNAAVVDDWFRSAAPEGNAPDLRYALQRGAQQRIADAEAAAEGVRGANAALEQAVTPTMTPTDRGYAIRSGLQSRADAEQADIASLYGQIDDTVPVDPAGLQERLAGVTEQLPLNDRVRFAPGETATAEQLAAGGDLVPVSEAMAIRSGLASDLRATSATDQQRRVTGQYLSEVDDFIRSALPEDQRALMDQGKGARLDYGRRFEDRGAVPDILRETGRGQYRMADETVPGRAMRGETDYRAVMAEAGGDEAARRAVADQILADAQQANALRSPEALARFSQSRNFALGDFPELEPALRRAGVSRQMLDQAERTAAETARDLSPGGPSATGQYLRYDDTGTRQAIKTAWNSDQPERAIRELLEVAGDTPQTRNAAKAALWEEVQATGQLSARTETDDGVQRWSGRKLADLMDNPRFAKTAEVLWSDDPQHLANIREAADALAGAEGSLRARAPSSSGTAQSLGGKHDPALSAASISSRARSVSRGVLSPSIAAIDIMSTALRRRAGSVQAKAIDEMLAQAINDPEFAAALLRKHNPAHERAVKRQILQLYGARVPTLANILAGEDDEDPLQVLGGEDQ